MPCKFLNFSFMNVVYSPLYFIAYMNYDYRLSKISLLVDGINGDGGNDNRNNNNSIIVRESNMMASLLSILLPMLQVSWTSSPSMLVSLPLLLTLFALYALVSFTRMLTLHWYRDKSNDASSVASERLKERSALFEERVVTYVAFC